MPRLLPRLLQVLHNSRSRPPPSLPPTTRRRCKLDAGQPPPELPSLLPHGRRQSIVLDSLFALTKSNRYRRHKSWIPLVRSVPRRRKPPGAEAHPQHESRRAMTPEERTYWADPYLRMLASPMRLCILTNRYLPKAFMFRLSLMRLPALRLGRPMLTVLPDGLEHPDFATRQTGGGHYAVCWKEGCRQLLERTIYKHLTADTGMHSRIVEHVATLLRVRVLQELHVLAEHLQRRPRGALDAPLLRRLTRIEWRKIRASGVIPYENAVAVLVVPPLNRDRETKARTEPSMSALPVEDGQPAQSTRPLPPPSTLHPTDGEMTDEFEDELPDVFPRPQVPLYNSLTLFPSRPHRAALHAGLLRLLDVERRARFAEGARLAATNGQISRTHQSDEVSAGKSPWVRGDNKGSHAFLVCSDADTVLRADTVPLAIALWRLRMWEGGGFDGSKGRAGGWMTNKSYNHSALP
ncbi:hypothetical protein B0H21DRAFT_28383 [Amylocystis lapponica]|nr:hypothetical protein B0H21DRAFT_28383 [Amylocystis lapponica]